MSLWTRHLIFSSEPKVPQVFERTPQFPPRLVFLCHRPQQSPSPPLQTWKTSAPESHWRRFVTGAWHAMPHCGQQSALLDSGRVFPRNPVQFERFPHCALCPVTKTWQRSLSDSDIHIKFESILNQYALKGLYCLVTNHRNRNINLQKLWDWIKDNNKETVHFKSIRPT